MSRFDGYTATPELARPMMALSAAISKSKCVSQQLRDLLECRVSQLNGCAFCLRMHTKSYLENGGDVGPLYMLPTWRVSDGFSEPFRAALHWAECLTRNGCSEQLDQAHQALQAHFDLEQVSTLTFIVSTINAWNRLGLAQHGRA